MYRNGSTVDVIVCGHVHKTTEDVINDVPVINVGGFMKEGNALIVDSYEGKLTRLLKKDHPFRC